MVLVALYATGFEFYPRHTSTIKACACSLLGFYQLKITLLLLPVLSHPGALLLHCKVAMVVATFPGVCKQGAFCPQTANALIIINLTVSIPAVRDPLVGSHWIFLRSHAENTWISPFCTPQYINWRPEQRPPTAPPSNGHPKPGLGAGSLDFQRWPLANMPQPHRQRSLQRRSLSAWSLPLHYRHPSPAPQTTTPSWDKRRTEIPEPRQIVYFFRQQTEPLFPIFSRKMHLLIPQPLHNLQS